MAWKKNLPDAVQRFDELVAVPGASRKIMFGCPVYVLGEQRYASLHQNRVVLRLSPKDAAQLIAKGGRPFEPFKGRPVKDRVTVPETIVANARALRGWVRRAVRHARGTAGEA
jgi:TfoX/Sxy family transcriptional regulator of competence genes